MSIYNRTYKNHKIFVERCGAANEACKAEVFNSNGDKVLEVFTLYSPLDALRGAEKRIDSFGETIEDNKIVRFLHSSFKTMKFAPFFNKLRKRRVKAKEARRIRVHNKKNS